MKLLLLKAARINHNPGETVVASPEQAQFLLSVGAAVIAEAEQREAPKPKRTTRKA